MITSPYLPRFVMITVRRWPRSKKRRIRKKWAKDPRRVVTIPKKPLERYVLQTSFGIHMHPDTWVQVRRTIEAAR